MVIGSDPSRLFFDNTVLLRPVCKTPTLTKVAVYTASYTK